jgi:hypothetical protein
MSKSFSGLINPPSNAPARVENTETAGVSIESAPSLEQKAYETFGSYTKASECELLQAARLGDDEAFIELCRRNSPSAKRRIYSIVQNQEDTEDALQDTLLRAYIHLCGFRGGCKFGTWITTIASNSASDNGPGIPASVRRTLFDPFVTAGKPTGTGLGLTLARRIAEEHGGSVCLVESNPGRTVFTLSLTKNRSLSLEDLKSGRASFEACSNGSANCS